MRVREQVRSRLADAMQPLGLLANAGAVRAVAVPLSAGEVDTPSQTAQTPRRLAPTEVDGRAIVTTVAVTQHAEAPSRVVHAPNRVVPAAKVRTLRRSACL